MNKRFSKILSLGMLVVLTLSLATSGSYGASKKKMLEAYEDIQIEYNGTTLTDADGPLLINNKTYIPLRMLMNYFGDKDIAWDNASRKVKVNSKQNQMEAMYMAQLSTRNSQIASLEQQVKDLKAQLAATKDTTTEDDKVMTKLSKDLDDDYENYDKKDVSVSVSGTATKVNLTVKIDKADWDDFSTSEKNTFMEKICDDIWDEFSKATVDGTIKDGSKTLDSFSVKAGKDVDFDDEDEDDEPDFDSLTSAIVKKYKADWIDEKLVLSLAISGTDTKITYKATLDMSKYDDEWDDLSSSQQKNLMDDIYDDIKAKYSKATITGYLYDSKEKKNVVKYDGSKMTEY